MKSEARQLFPLLFAVFVSMLGVGIISPLLPIYAEMLGAGGFAIGIIYGLFSLSRAVVMPFYGRLSDLKGRKVFIAAGLAAYCVLSLAYAYADSLATLAVVRLLHGFASAAILPIAMAFMGDLSPGGKEGRYMGIFTTTLFLGFGFGPVIGGAIKDAAGINEAFYFMGALVFIGLLLVIFLVEDPRQKAKALKRYPLREILASRMIRAIFIYRFSGALTRGTVFAFLPIYAHNELSLSGTALGIIISGEVFIASLLQTPFGLLADRFSRPALVATGGLIQAACLYAIVHCDTFSLLAIVICIKGIGGAMSVPALSALAVDEGRALGMGSVMGIFNLAMSLGQSIGPFVMGYLMHLGGVKIPFQVTAVCVVLGTLLFIVEIARARNH